MILKTKVIVICPCRNSLELGFLRVLCLSYSCVAEVKNIFDYGHVMILVATRAASSAVVINMFQNWLACWLGSELEFICNIGRFVT